MFCRWFGGLATILIAQESIFSTGNHRFLECVWHPIFFQEVSQDSTGEATVRGKRCGRMVVDYT